MLIKGTPREDFRNVVAIIISNAYDNKKMFFPSKEESMKCAQKKYENNLLWQLTGIAKMDGDRKIAESSSREENIKFLMYDDFVMRVKILGAIWFEQVMDRLKDEGLESNDVSEFMSCGEWISETNKFLIGEAVSLFWEERYAAFMHVAIPIYESIFRRHFSFHNISTTHISPTDCSQQEKIFGEFLRSDTVRDNVPVTLLELSEVIFTEKNGLNLRNKIAHGLCEKDDFDKNTAYIVLLMLILVTAFDWIANNKNTDDSES
jgi:hypothetical protein